MREGSRTSEIHAGSDALDDAAVVPRIEAEKDGRDDIDMIELLLILSRKKAAIFKLTLAAVVLAVIVSLLLPKMYTATSTILPPQQSQSALTAMLGQLSAVAGLNESDLGLKNPGDLFIAMLKSRTIEDRLVDRFDLRQVYGVKRYQDARKKLEGRSYIIAEREGLISISVTDRDPQRAADLANAYVEALHVMNSDLGGFRSCPAPGFLSAKTGCRTRRVVAGRAGAETGAGEKRTAAARRPGPGDYPERGQHAGASCHQGGPTASHAQLCYRRKSRSAAGGAGVGGLRAQLAKLERNTGEIGNGNVELPTRQLPQAELEYIRRARDLKYHEAFYDFLSKQLEAARLDEAKDAVVVQVVDKAVVPERKSSPRRMMIVLVTAIAAFILACLGVLLAEIVRRKEQDPQDRERLALLRHSLKSSS